jgi:RNA polymerase sigma-70 factor (ECF subfamily)
MSLVTRTQSDLPEPDEALMIRAAQGDRAAFDVLCARHLPRLYVVALRLCADPPLAEEIAQDAMVRAWRNAARFDPDRGKLATWLNRIAVNLAIDRQRTARPLDALADDLPATEPDALQVIESRDRTAALASGLAALPPRQRAALLLTYADGGAGKDVARTLGVSVRALEGLLRRGRLFLKDWLLAREM